MKEQFLRFKRVLIVFLFPVIIFAITSITESAEFRIQPSITISEEYDDNVFLEKEDTVDEYITRVQPSIVLEFKDLRWELDIDYGLDYRYFANGGEDDTSHDLEVNGKFEILKELFFLNISDTYSRVSLDITRDFARESLFVNQSDRNIFSVNPYFILRPASLTTVTSGYIFTDTWFKEDTAIDRRNHVAYVDTDFELSRKHTLTAAYRYTQSDSDVTDYNKNDASLGSSYEYAEESFLTVTIGNSWLDFKEAGSNNHIFWNAGISNKFHAFTVQLQSSRDYIEDPEGDLTRVDSYTVTLNKPAERISYGISASFKEFRDAVNEVLEDRSYGVSGYFTYEITPKMTGTVDFTAEKIEEELEDTYTRRYRPTVGINYALLEDFTLAFIYQYIDSDSPKIEENNYKNNRFTLAMSKSF